MHRIHLNPMEIEEIFYVSKNTLKFTLYLNLNFPPLN